MQPEFNNESGKANSKIAIAFFLNLGFTIIEFIGGALSNSTAIMADAVHDLGDSLSIGSAWVLQYLSGKESNDRFTYGYRRLSLLGALLNGMVLIAGSLWVLLKAIPRLTDPVLPAVEGMFALAIFGVVVNGIAAYKLSDGKSLNERVLNWHLLEDVLGWIAVLLVSITLWFVHWPILDPVLAIGFTLFVLFNVIKNTGSAVQLFLQATPEKDLLIRVRRALLNLEGVQDAHHEHAWSLDGESHVYTAHLMLDSAVDTDEQLALKEKIAEILREYNFQHTTIELEMPQEYCRDA